MFSQSFPPIADRNVRILILGSMPGTASLDAEQYYAHPRNAFWPIVLAILNDSDKPESVFPDYAQRLEALRCCGVGLWDVLQTCYREGSLDSSIKEESIVANDFLSLFRETPKLRAVFFNGAKAEHSFRKFVHADIKQEFGQVDLVRLPSTSPAHASLGVPEKLEQWRQIQDYL
ncbi:MAG: DNA-deoxyinosine glycosylase [Pseudomonadales bacterium]